MKKYLPIIILAIVLLVVWVMFFNDAPSAPAPSSSEPAADGIRLN